MSGPLSFLVAHLGPRGLLRRTADIDVLWCLDLIPEMWHFVLMYTGVAQQTKVPRRGLSRPISAVLGLVMLGAVCGCQSDTPRLEIPESNYPEDQPDGYQEGGGGMVTYVPTQDGYETIGPSDTYQTVEPSE